MRPAGYTHHADLCAIYGPRVWHERACMYIVCCISKAERSHLEQRLNAVEARVSEAARQRADLSRRLAETAVEAEEAGVENQRLEHSVRV